MVSLAYAFLVGTLASTVVFVLFPGELGYSRPEYVAEFDFLFQLLYQLDRPHNLYPSLHVTFSSLTDKCSVVSRDHSNMGSCNCYLGNIGSSASHVRYFDRVRSGWFLLQVCLSPICLAVILWSRGRIQTKFRIDTINLK